MEFFGPHSNSNVPSILLRRASSAADDSHKYRSTVPAAAEELDEEEELDGFVMVKPRQMGKQLESSLAASYQSKESTDGEFARATAAKKAGVVLGSTSACAADFCSKKKSTSAAPPPPLQYPIPTSTTETPEDEKVKDPDVWKRTPEEEEKLYKILNGPIKMPPPASTSTFAWPPTEEEEAVIQQVLYRSSGRRSRLPVFSQICPAEGGAQAAPDSTSLPMQRCMRK